MTNNEIIKEIEESAKLLKQTKATVNAALCHARNILEQKADSEDVDAAYNRGLNDAWELMMKIFEMSPQMRKKFLEKIFVIRFYVVILHKNY